MSDSLSDDQISQLLNAERPDQVAEIMRQVLPAGRSATVIYRLADGDEQPAAIADLANHLYDLRNTEATQNSPETAWRAMWALASIIPDLAAPALHTLGRAYNNSGAYKDAVLPLQTAIFAYAAAEDPEGVARAKNTLASAYRSLGEYAKAEELTRAAVAFFRTPPDDPAIDYRHPQAVSGKLLADILADLQRPDDALNEYERALHIAHTLGNPVFIGNIIDSRSSVLEEQLDQFKQAEAGYNEAETYYATSKDWRDTFTLNLNRAILTLRLGRHAEARRYLAAAKQAASADTQGSEQSDLGLYRAYQRLVLGDLAAAQHELAHVERLLAVDEQRLRGSAIAADADQWAPQSSQEEIQLFRRQRAFSALLHGLLSRNLEHALAYLETAAKYYADRQLPLDQALVEAERARIYYRLATIDTTRSDNLNSARKALQRAETLLRSFNPSPPQRMRSLAAIRAAADPDVTTDELQALIEQFSPHDDPALTLPVFMRLGKFYHQAQAHNAARKNYRQAIELVRKSRGFARVSVQHADAITAIRKPYEQLIVLSSGADPAEAYTAAEDVRVQIFLDDLVPDRPNGLAFSNRADPAYQALEQARTRLQYARARAAMLRPRAVTTNTRRDVDVFDRELDKAQYDYEQALQSLQHDSAQSVPALQRLQAEDYRTIQAGLAADAALLIYTLISAESQEEEAVYATIVYATGIPRSFQLLSTEQLQDLRRDWNEDRTKLIDQHALAKDSDEFLDGIAYHLEALKPYLTDVRNLIVVPDDRLPLIPIHALRFDDDYLLRRCTVSYAPSATVLQFCREREHTRMAQDRADPVALTVGWRSSGTDTLEKVEQELALLSKILHCEPHHGFQKISELSHDLQRADLIHLSCHGRFPDAEQQDTLARNPRFAALNLGEDLYAHDLYGMDLQAALLTLSACDTAKVGAGFQGLVSAGLAAGASSVIAGLWEVLDEITPQLMPKFYCFLLKEKLSRAEALRRAQLALIDAGARPFEWAPFVLIGVPDPLPFA